MSKKFYLKVSPTKAHQDYNDYYHLVEDHDTWEDTLKTIEDELEAHYVDNDMNIDGIKFEIEIFKNLPEDVEFEEF